MSGMMRTGTPLATQTTEDFLQPFDMAQMEGPMQDMWKKAYVNPAMRTFNEDIVPALQQNMASQNTSSSSALDQALARSAEMLSTDLGSKYGDLMMQQQGRSDTNRTNALNALLGLSGRQTFTPQYEDKQGWVSQLNQIMSTIANVGKVGAGMYGGF